MNISQVKDESWTTETRKKVEVSIEQGLDLFAVGGTSVSVTGGMENASTTARSIAKSQGRGYKKQCGQNIDMVKYNIHKVWQWQVTAHVDGNPIVIKTCEIACTPDGNEPTFRPGQQAAIGTCLHLREAKSQAGAVQQPNPQAATPQPNPQAVTQQPNPQAVTQQPNAQVVTQQPNPQVVTQQPNPQVVTQQPNAQAINPAGAGELAGIYNISSGGQMSISVAQNGYFYMNWPNNESHAAWFYADTSQVGVWRGDPLTTPVSYTYVRMPDGKLDYNNGEQVLTPAR